MPLEARPIGKLAVRVSTPKGNVVYRVSRLINPLSNSEGRAIALSTIGGGENIVVAETDSEGNVVTTYPDRIPWVLAAADVISRYEADTWARRIRFFHGKNLELIESISSTHSIYGTENQLELVVINNEYNLAVLWYNCFTGNIVSPVEWQYRMNLLDYESARREKEKVQVYVDKVRKKCSFYTS